MKFQNEWFQHKNFIIDYKLTEKQTKQLTIWSKSNLQKINKIKSSKIKKDIVILNNIFCSTNEYVLINLIKTSNNPTNGFILKFSYKVLNKNFKNIESDKIWIKYSHKDHRFYKFLIDSKINKKIYKSGITVNHFILKLMTILKNRTIISINDNEDISFLHWYIAAYLFNTKNNLEIEYWKKYFNRNSLGYDNHISLYDMYEIIKNIGMNDFKLEYQNLLDTDNNKIFFNNLIIPKLNIKNIKEIFLDCYKKIKIGKNIW